MGNFIHENLIFRLLFLYQIPTEHKKFLDNSIISFRIENTPLENYFNQFEKISFILFYSILNNDISYTLTFQKKDDEINGYINSDNFIFYYLFMKENNNIKEEHGFEILDALSIADKKIKSSYNYKINKNAIFLKATEPYIIKIKNQFKESISLYVFKKYNVKINFFKKYLHFIMRRKYKESIIYLNSFNEKQYNSLIYTTLIGITINEIEIEQILLSDFEVPNDLDLYLKNIEYKVFIKNLKKLQTKISKDYEGLIDIEIASEIFRK